MCRFELLYNMAVDIAIQATRMRKSAERILRQPSGFFFECLVNSQAETKASTNFVKGSGGITERPALVPCEVW